MSKVSVVIPTFNRRNLVAEAVQSVLAQNLRDIEIIVVDDGSTDGTAGLLSDRFADRLRYTWQPNAGRSAARNRGALQARGEYIVFLDSDDLVMPDGPSLLAACLDRHPGVDVAFGDGYFCDPSGVAIERASRGRPTVDPSRMLDTLVLHNIITAPHLAMVRRTVFETLAYPFFDEALHGTEDADFWIRLAAEGFAFRAVPAAVGRYRLHGANESSPSSPGRSRRNESVRRGRLKILDAPYFEALSRATRREFLRQLLLNTLGGQIADQESVLSGHRFAALPESDQVALLRFTALANIIEDGRIAEGRQRLRRALALEPSHVKTRAALALSYSAPILVRLIVRLWRRVLTLRQQTDYSTAPHWRVAKGR